MSFHILCIHYCDSNGLQVLFCCEGLESRMQKAKKLLLFEKAGRKYLTVLNDLAEERFGSPLDESQHDSREKTYICHSCCCSIDKLFSLRKKAEEKSKVMDKLESVLNTGPQQQVTQINFFHCLNWFPFAELYINTKNI